VGDHLAAGLDLGGARFAGVGSLGGDAPLAAVLVVEVEVAGGEPTVGIVVVGGDEAGHLGARRLVAVVDHSVHEVIDFYATREEALETLEEVLDGEPRWAGMVEVVQVELGSVSKNSRQVEFVGGSVVHSARCGLPAMRR
jgi:hypothetical protein